MRRVTYLLIVRVDGVLLLCESLLQHLLVSEPDAGVIVYGSAYLRVLCKHYSCTFARPRVALALCCCRLLSRSGGWRSVNDSTAAYNSIFAPG